MWAAEHGVGDERLYYVNPWKYWMPNDPEAGPPAWKAQRAADYAIEGRHQRGGRRRLDDRPG